ncbi:MAG TPA: lamin tail domain-containing protein [Prolixibacteraceae bacterium]
MMKRIQWVLIVLITVGMISCNKDKDEAVTDINKSIVINEVMPKNTGFGSDQDNEFDDWIEIYNLADQDIDVSGYYLTDNKSKLTQWQFPEGTTLAKNGYLIVWVDGDSTQVGLHTPFKLSALGETVLLLTPEQKVIQEVTYPEISLLQSYSRIPNGTGDFIWATPTFGVVNKEADPGLNINKSIVINELMAKNTQYGSDQNGEFDDWIELYNLADQDIDISGFYLTDSKKDLTKWQFPQGTTLAKNGYLIVWADADTLQVGLHANYKLSSLGETVVLVSPEKVVINEVKYPVANSLQSFGRIPNGTGDFILTTPTFKAENK